jgi:hypothetical protein
MSIENDLGRNGGLNRCPMEHDLNDNFVHYSFAKAMSDQIDNGNNFIGECN